jgi:hypothetical protein
VQLCHAGCEAAVVVLTLGATNDLAHLRQQKIKL